MSAVVFGLGSAQFGRAYGIANKSGAPDLGTVLEILEKAYANGVRVIDTAQAYGDSERTLGLCDAPRKFRIVTKLSPELVPDDESSVKKLEESLEQSKRNLECDQLDTVLFHRGFQALRNGGRLWDILADKKFAGEVKRIGISAVDPAEAWGGLELEGLDAIQVASSLLDRRLYQTGFFDAAEKRGVEVFIRSVYLQGVAHLGGDSLPDFLAYFRPTLEQLDQIAEDSNFQRWQLFLLWAKSRLSGTVILGLETLPQLEANVRAWNSECPEQVLEACELVAGTGSDGPLNPGSWYK